MNHYRHPKYGAAFDYLASNGTAEAKRFRTAMGYTESSGRTPIKHELIDFWRACINHHWRLLRVEGSYFDPLTDKAAYQRCLRYITVIVRCRWFYAVTCAMERSSRNYGA